MIVYSLWMYKEWSSVNIGDVSLLGMEQLVRPLLNESLKLSDIPAPWCVIHQHPNSGTSHSILETLIHLGYAVGYHLRTHMNTSRIIDM